MRTPLSAVAPAIWTLVIGTSACLAPGSSGQAVGVRDVVINEIHYDPESQDLEFVELYNRSSAKVDLARFELADSRMVPVGFGDAAESIAPGGFAVLARDREALVSSWPDAGSDAPVVKPSSWPALNNTGDAVVLLVDGVAIDSLTYDPDWGGDGVSLERIDPNGPSGSASNWSSSTDKSAATPGKVNSVYSPDVEPPRVVFAEHAIDATAVVVTFTEPVFLPESTNPSFVVDTALPSGIVIDEATRHRVTLLGVAPDARTLEVAGVLDYVGNVLESTTVAIARTPLAGEIVVNEIMYEPSSHQVEYVELANTTDDLLNLRGLRLTRAPDERTVVDQPIGLPSARFAVLFADPKEPSPLTLAHPRDYESLGAVLIPIRATSLGLGNSGDEIRLSTLAGVALDSVHYDPSWHNPNLRASVGVALERIDPLGPSSIRRNWTSSASVDGGTPGSQNSVFLSPKPADDRGGLRVEPSPFSPDGDGVDDLAGVAYALASDASVVRIRIFDARGRHVRTLVESMLSGRSGSVTWDGLDDRGHWLQVGIYVVLLESTDTAGGTAEKHKATVVLARRLD